MMQKQEQSFHALEALIRQRLESAQQRAANAQDASMSRYYKGQADTFHIVLRDIEAIQFENGLELGVTSKPTFAPVIELQSLSRSVEEPVDVSASAQRPREASTRKIKRLPKITEIETESNAKTRKKAEPKEPPTSEYAALAQEALEKNVITQRASWFFNTLIPNGCIKGFRKLYQLFEQDAAFRQAIADACAAQPVVLPESPLDTPFEAA